MAHQRYTGPLPTVGDFRRGQLKALRVYCDILCGRNRRFTFDELRLPDDMIFVHVPRYRRFVCTVCGTRAMQIMPDWSDAPAQGVPRRPRRE